MFHIGIIPFPPCERCISKAGILHVSPSQSPMQCFFYDLWHYRRKFYSNRTQSARILRVLKGAIAIDDFSRKTPFQMSALRSSPTTRSRPGCVDEYSVCPLPSSPPQVTPASEHLWARHGRHHCHYWQVGDKCGNGHPAVPLSTAPRRPTAEGSFRTQAPPTPTLGRAIKRPAAAGSPLGSSQAISVSRGVPRPPSHTTCGPPRTSTAAPGPFGHLRSVGWSTRTALRCPANV